MVAGAKPGDRWAPTWEPERFLEDCPNPVDEFWQREYTTGKLNKQDTFEPGLGTLPNGDDAIAEHRCVSCCFPPQQNACGFEDTHAPLRIGAWLANRTENREGYQSDEKT